ncbi:polysaccharide lyase family 1 protein [Aspergillus neoniger CBS 115656]|uniref:pectin lyase n=1 Tax=Aspergillus neoniger (strain CBS 115656) TaxID=1448310 RepID=A0A318YCW8_ASPNB|nr:pectin lyase F [Aspergillus neoniger CBS 115656]PYH31427.1 pectin lyase F [Aspergillus neoniger CBS 115656]
MTLLRHLLTATALLGASVQAAQGVTGSPFGFASGTTGGGDATPAAPSDISQLKTWLSDSTPRVILIDKEFNFLGSEGKCTNCECCKPASNTCGSSGQNAVKQNGSDWCGSYPTLTCTYDNAGIEGLEVASNKSIVGVGSSGVLRGKGLRLVNGVSNIIIQNIHITELNPEFIWGGDAITLDGTNNVWIDHVKINLIGRQMFVAGYEASHSVTISNSEFDGETSWSATCDGHHYWTVLGYGHNDKITFANNYIHHTSGRSPKLEFNSFWHAYNNYWFNNTGHAFDVGKNTRALIEGNVMVQVDTPLLADSNPGAVFAVNTSDVSTCTSTLGRTCVPNTLISSGTLSGSDSSVISSWPSGESDVTVMAASKVASYVKANAGIGKLSNGSGSSSTVGAAATSAVAKRADSDDAPYVPAYSEAGPGASAVPSQPSWSWRTVTNGPAPTGAPSDAPAPAPKGLGAPVQASNKHHHKGHGRGY